MANAVKQATLTSSGAVPGGGVYELWKVFDAELVASTGVVDSVMHTGNARLGFSNEEFRYFGLWINATSVSGTADVKVEIIQSHDDTAANYVVPAENGIVVASLGETAAVYALFPTPLPRMRLRVTGVSANPSDTVVSAHFWRQT